MSYSVKEAFFVLSSDERRDQLNYYPNVYKNITSFFQREFYAERDIRIDPSVEHFNLSIASSSFLELNSLPQVKGKEITSKIQVVLKEENGVNEFTIIAVEDIGFSIRSQVQNKIIQDVPAGTGKIIILNSADGFKIAGSTARIEKIAKDFGYDPEIGRKAGDVLNKGEEAAGKAASLAKSVFEKDTRLIYYDEPLKKGRREAVMGHLKSKSPLRNKEFQRCLIRFAGGNSFIEEKGGKTYRLDQSAPGYQAWINKTKSEGPILGTIDNWNTYRVKRAVDFLRDSMNKYNTEKNSDLFIREGDDWTTENFLKSPACADFHHFDKITVKENKNNVLIDDYKFLSDKNKKLHSVLMETLKKDIKEDK